MKVLAFAEQREGKFRKSAFEVAKAGKVLADQLGGEVLGVVMGHSVDTISAALGGYGKQSPIPR